MGSIDSFAFISQASPEIIRTPGMAMHDIANALVVSINLDVFTSP
jgi:hypothetical protein